MESWIVTIQPSPLLSFSGRNLVRISTVLDNEKIPLKIKSFNSGSRYKTRSLIMWYTILMIVWAIA